AEQSEAKRTQRTSPHAAATSAPPRPLREGCEPGRAGRARCVGRAPPPVAPATRRAEQPRGGPATDPPLGQNHSGLGTWDSGLGTSLSLSPPVQDRPEIPAHVDV